MGVELVTDREKRTPATKTAAQVVRRYVKALQNSKVNVSVLGLPTWHVALAWFPAISLIVTG